MNSTMLATMPPAVRQMRVGLLVIGLQFIIPALGYIVDPKSAVATVQAINALLGGASAWTEQSHIWHMLAVGNVMTLGVLCLIIRSDVVRFLPALPGLLFLKAFSALYSLAIALHEGLPAFFAVFVLDGSTTVLMGVLALRAAHALARDQTAPWWARWVLIAPERIETMLARIPDAPTLWQVFQGALRMWHRIVFRSETVGTCTTRPVRSTWRARVLQIRALRLPVLLWERAIAPLDPTGLCSSPERIHHHLLAAHHDGAQLVYDLELLRLHVGGLEGLRPLVAAVVDGTHPRAAFFQDLCVFTGYHDDLLAAVDAALAGAPLDPAILADADLTLEGFLRWCRRQPAAPGTYGAQPVAVRTSG